MVKSSLIRSAVRYALMTGAVVTAAGAAATASAENANTPAQLGKVTVTGSRIKRTSIETAQPITRISRHEIEQSGFTNVGQLLGQLSFAGSHSNGASGHTNGRTTINLRNLGANRNLVLVNGKRWISVLGGSTNLNTIPTSIIDHIEILQDGASAVYGSDAIAGVVNIITVKNFNGAEAHAYYGIHNDHQTGSWDGQVKQYDFTIGSGNDRGNVVFNATYREQNVIEDNDRKLLRTTIPGITPDSPGAIVYRQSRFELFGPAVGGRTFGQGTCSTYDPANPTKILCDLVLQKVPAQPSTQNFENTPQSNKKITLHKYPALLAPTKDVSVYVQGHYDLFDNVTFTANAAYIREEVDRHDDPDGTGIGLTSHHVANGKPIGIAATNPYNPFGVDLVANSTDPCLAAGTCIGLSAAFRNFDEGEPREANFDRDYFHISLGFNGYANLFNREIDWDVGFAQNRVQASQLLQHVGNTVHEAKALGPAAQCTAPCVPLNYFGGVIKGGAGSITQSQLNYLHFERHNISQTNLRDWTANLSSDMYDLPAGPLGLAIGYERIDNYGYSHPDSIQVNGNDFTGVSGNLLNGRVVRNAEYAEINIPLLADLPGVKNLSVDIANRWTQFKRSGGVTGQNESASFVHNSSGRLNIRYQVTNDLLLRASWSQGFRSPNVSELFGGQNQTPAAIVDPCAGPPYGGYSGGPLPPNCPNGNLDAQSVARVAAIVGSNAQLKPESSISRTVGFVYSPSQVPGLDINADYFKIEITDAGGTGGAQSILNGCFYNFSFCNLVTTKANQVIFIRNVDTNVGSLLTEGIDVGLHYKFPSTPVGDFDARINGTFLKAYDQTKVNLATKTGFATSHLAGVEPRAKRRFNGYLDWDYGNWSAQYHIQYIGAVVDRCRVSIKGYCTYPNRTTNFQGAPGQFSLGRQHLGATVYHDVHVAYTVPSINTTLAVGVNNLFDKKPPIPGRSGYQPFDFGLYRLPSRVVYGDIRVRF
jgi:outer membrane receptor protein involved in Fe transport